MKLAGNQPYLFPYIGFFQLINAVDIFVLEDTLNFIERGWINRNNILLNGEKKLFTYSLLNSSSNDKINQIVTSQVPVKILKLFRHAYSKAPYFQTVFAMLEDIFMSFPPNSFISELAIRSILETNKYLGIKTTCEIGSSLNLNLTDLKKERRIFKICEHFKANTLVNAIGGKQLYDKEMFRQQGLDLFFISSKPPHYKQFNNEFVPNLSIIDVMMFNTPEEIKEMLTHYELV
jgi:hypothetical protein